MRGRGRAAVRRPAAADRGGARGTPAAAEAPAPGGGPPAGGTGHRAGAGRCSGAAPRAPAAPEDLPDPDVEDVEVTDLLLVVDLKDEVLVLDEHPRYHLAGCVHLRGRTPIPLPHDEARTDGFTPCAVCEPDHTLADQVRARKATKGS